MIAEPAAWRSVRSGKRPPSETRVRSDAVGESRRLSLTSNPGEFAFCGRELPPVAEPGDLHAWIGGCATAVLRTAFTLVESTGDQRGHTQ